MRRATNPSPRADTNLPTSLHPTEEEVATLAYELFLRRGASDGRDLDDWLDAEQQLLEERSKHIAAV